MPNLMRLQRKKRKVEKESVNCSILEKEKTSAHIIAAPAILSLARKMRKSNKLTTSFMKNFGEGNKKTNSDGIANVVKTA